MGHSLGGSLALTFVAAGLVPPSFKGRVTAVAIGSPAILYTPETGGAGGGGSRAAAALSYNGDGGGVPAAAARTVACPAGAAKARVLVFVNKADAVPRLLGSPLALVGNYFSAAVGEGRRDGRRGARHAAMATLESYSHIPQTQVIWLNSEGAALAVPIDQRDAVLHLHEALSFELHRTLLNDHEGEGYIRGITAALADTGGPPSQPLRPRHPPAPDPSAPDRFFTASSFTWEPPNVAMGVPVAEGAGINTCGSSANVRMGTPVSSSAAAGAATCPAGSLVHRTAMIRGLVSKPEYNGKVGLLTSWDGATGRYLVALDGTEFEQDVTVRPENLELR